jgi:hypothetical protein
MHPVEIQFGPLIVKVARSGLFLFVRDAQGRRAARHLTLPFEPWPGPEDAGRYRPHISDPGGRTRRYFLAKIRQADLDQAFRAIGADVLDLWARGTRPVDLGRLQGEGWQVLPPGAEQMAALIDRTVRVRDRVYRVSEPALARLAELTLAGALEPLAVAARGDPGRPLAAVRVGADGEVAEGCVLGFFPAGLAGGAPGWYATREGWFTFDDFTAIIDRHVGPKFWRALLEAHDRLGLPVERERLLALAERAA